MMGAPFAKLFDTEHGQLLAYLCDDDTDQFSIRVLGALVRGVQPSAKLGYNSETERQCGFDGIDQALAETTARQLFAIADKTAPPSAVPNGEASK